MSDADWITVNLDRSDRAVYARRAGYFGDRLLGDRLQFRDRPHARQYGRHVVRRVHGRLRPAGDAAVHP